MHVHLLHILAVLNHLTLPVTFIACNYMYIYLWLLIMVTMVKKDLQKYMQMTKYYAFIT